MTSLLTMPYYRLPFLSRLVLGFFPLMTPAIAQVAWMPSTPGVVAATATASRVHLSTGAVEIGLERRSRNYLLRCHSPWIDQDLAVDCHPFSIVFRSGRKLNASLMARVAGPKITSLAADSKSLIEGERTSGRSISESFTDSASGLEARWRIFMREGSNYVRSEVVFTATRKPVDIERVALIDFDANDLPKAWVLGSVPGSPIVAGNWWASMEHPMAESSVALGKATSLITRKIPLQKGQSVTYASIIGVSPEGQLRRGFARYVDRERARPFHPFLHYNSWYDIGYFTKYDESQTLDRIRAFGDHLVRARGVTLDSFLFDDGWDDPTTVWQFHAGFPNGFTPLKMLAASYGAGPGVWLSPWGGYGGPRAQRLATGKRLGYEIDAQGYALSGPKYYARFREACLKMVTDFGINQFKLDGTGSPDKQVAGSPFASDFEAAIQLIKDLRVAQPKLFVNLTTGTWPSPFWTRTVDSIWRGGEDHSFAGVGTNRQKWITYRDGDTYNGIVKRGPLFPINSLMLHGLIYAQHAHNLNSDPGSDFQSEVRSYFGSGTQLQEMYITPSLLSPTDWNCLAEAAKWSRANADVFQDVHWVGGDPTKLEAYGWAAFAGKKGILTLRNPSDTMQAFSVNWRSVFELPAQVNGSFSLQSPWPDSPKNMNVRIGESTVLVLKPFEVVTLEGELR